MFVYNNFLVENPSVHTRVFLTLISFISLACIFNITLYWIMFRYAQSAVRC